MQYALDQIDDKAVVYFLEDDYLHRPGAGKVINEGLTLGDYVTLYDHPDKYQGACRSVNPDLTGRGEVSEVLLTPTTHWKMTNSTTMTFACRGQTLREDMEVWRRHTEGTHPNDYGAFRELLERSARTRELLCPIPGYSTHVEVDYPSPLIQWKQVARGSQWRGLGKTVWARFFR